MFDIGWTEMLVVAVVAIIVVGPKDLPKMLRSVGKAMGGMRRMAGDFQRQFDDALREAELDEVKNIAKGKTFQPLEDACKAAEKFNRDVKETVSGTARDIEEAAGKPAAETKPAADAGDDPGAKADHGAAAKLPEPAARAETAAKSAPKTQTKPAARSQSKPAASKAAKPAAPAAKKPAAKKPAKSARAS